MTICFFLHSGGWSCWMNGCFWSLQLCATYRDADQVLSALDLLTSFLERDGSAGAISPAYALELLLKVLQPILCWRVGKAAAATRFAGLRATLAALQSGMISVVSTSSAFINHRPQSHWDILQPLKTAHGCFPQTVCPKSHCRCRQPLVRYAKSNVWLAVPVAQTILLRSSL